MGVLSNVVNRIRFKSVEPLDSNKTLSMGICKDGSVALLKYGKIVEDKLKRISTNLINSKRNEYNKVNKDFLVCETQDGDYRVYFANGDVFIDSLKEPSDPNVVVNKTKNYYVVDFELGKFVFIPNRMYISELLEFIDDKGIDGLRMVTQKHFDNENQLSYYVDDEFRIKSPEFIEELEAGDLKILTICYPSKREKDILCNKNYKIVAGPYNEINYEDGRFFAKKHNQETVLINEKGESLTGGLNEYHVFGNGSVLALEKDKRNARLIDKDDETVMLVKEPIVDVNTGVIAGIVSDKYVMFGYDHKTLFEVDQHVAKLIIDKLQGKKLASQYVSYVLEHEIDMKPTMEAYEKIIENNLEQDPMNYTLEELKDTARIKFLKALDKASYERVRRTKQKIKKLTKERDKMIEQAAVYRKKQHQVSKFNSMINEVEEEK